MALVVGLGAGISATAVVTATLAERGIATCPLGRSSTALLVFQDVAGIFLLVFAVSLDGSGPLGWALAEAGAKAFAAALAAVVIGRFAARPALALLARANMAEVFTAAALLLVLATAAATGALGLSLTLGAFLAGVIVAETPYRTVVKTEARPFGALLLGFFFITVGMGLDWREMAAQAPWIALAITGLMLGKTILTFIAALASGWSRPGATPARLRHRAGLGVRPGPAGPALHRQRAGIPGGGRAGGRQRHFAGPDARLDGAGHEAGAQAGPGQSRPVHAVR